jgi:hypothetical protein
MKIMREWRQQTDGTLRLEDVGWSLTAGDTWGVCREGKPSPTSEKSWLYEFGKLIGAAAMVDECITDPRCRRQLGEKKRCPIKSMLGWTVRSRRIIGEIAQPLKLARLQLPTPPEFKGAIGQPFCELAIQLAEQRCVWLKRNFVTHTKESVRLPTDERVSDEAAKIVAHWDEVLKRWKFPAIDVEEWMRLIALELANCDWTLQVTHKGREWSDYRRPQEWRELRKNVHLSDSARTWTDLRKKHTDDMQGESHNKNKAIRIRRSLIISWGIKLPEFDSVTEG